MVLVNDDALALAVLRVLAELQLELAKGLDWYCRLMIE